jgi:beta-phosphoglucomutase
MTYGLIFDMDGVIADTEALIAEATIKMFRDLYGVELKPEHFYPYIGTGAVRYVEGPAQDHGVTIQLANAIEARHQNFVALLESGEDISLPGVKPLIAAAAEDPQWKLAIATSSPLKKSLETLKAANVSPDPFDAYITGDHVVNKKPHPEIYLKAADSIGLPPTSCVVLEDAVTGVASAKAAGMKCVAITNSFSANDLAQADRIVASLEEITLLDLRGMLEG